MDGTTREMSMQASRPLIVLASTQERAQAQRGALTRLLICPALLYSPSWTTRTSTGHATFWAGQHHWLPLHILCTTVPCGRSVGHPASIAGKFKRYVAFSPEETNIQLPFVTSAASSPVPLLYGADLAHSTGGRGCQVPFNIAFVSYTP